MGTYPFTAATYLPLVQPTGDTTGVKDTANIQAAITKGYVLAPGTFYAPPDLFVDTQQSLRGSGPGTIIQSVAGAGSYMVQLASATGTYQAAISDLTLKPSTGTIGGILLDNTGYSPAAGAPTSPLHVLDNVYIISATADAFHFGANARGLKVTRCRQDGGAGYGFYLDTGCTDSRFSDCTSGESALDGFYVKGWVNNFAACRTSLSGWTGGTPGATGIGWNILGGYNTWASCSAQQAALHGWQLVQGGGSACNYNAITGCEADTNNQGQTSGVGFNINGATYCTITGCVGANNGGVGSGQVYGMQVNGTMTGVSIFGNSVTGSNSDFNDLGATGYRTPFWNAH